MPGNGLGPVRSNARRGHGFAGQHGVGFQGDAPDCDKRPWDYLGVAMFAQDIAMDMVGVDPQVLSHQRPETGCIQGGA